VFGFLSVADGVTEHPVTGPEAGHRAADLDDLTGDVRAEHERQPDPGQNRRPTTCLIQSSGLVATA